MVDILGHLAFNILALALLGKRLETSALPMKRGHSFRDLIETRRQCPLIHLRQSSLGKKKAGILSYHRP